ncbi:MAG: hypothetical protein P1U52_12420 [Porticoccaceae bacterium]|nr:hypothetical protein [Porticoccaceae bacterium]
MTNFKVYIATLILTVIANANWALEPSREQANKSLIFADSALECGIYYEYTVGGLKKNPNVDNTVVLAIAQNSKALLHTAGLLYDAAGISIADRRKTFMHSARSMIKERQENPRSIDELIFDFGEKCKLLVATYSYRIKNITAEPSSI